MNPNAIKQRAAYVIRNDVTGHCWSASAGEARLYAIGGVADTGHYSVFEGGGTICLSKNEVR